MSHWALNIESKVQNKTKSLMEIGIQQKIGNVKWISATPGVLLSWGDFASSASVILRNLHFGKTSHGVHFVLERSRL